MGAKYNFLNLIGLLEKPAQSHTSILFIYYYLKYKWFSGFKTLKRNVIYFSTLIWFQGWKYKFINLISHLQDIPNHIREYHLSTIWNVDGVQVKSLLWQKTSFFDIHMTPGGHMKTPIPYCTFASPAQSYPRESII